MKTSQEYHKFRPTRNNYLLDLNELSTTPRLHGHTDDARGVSHAGIFRNPVAQSYLLTDTPEPQASSQTSMESQNTVSKEPQRSRFVKKRGWLSEVYATDDTPATLQIPDSPSTVRILESPSTARVPEPPSIASRPEAVEFVEEKKQGHQAPASRESGQHTLAAEFEEQCRDHQIKAVKEALLRSRSLSCEGLRSKASPVARSTSPPNRKKSLRRRSERTALLQRRKNSAFGEIRAAADEMCDLTQDLLTVIDEEVAEKTDTAAVPEESMEAAQTTGSKEAPSLKTRMGDRVHDSIGELRGLSEDVDQLTRDLRALKQLLRGEK